MKTNNIRLSLVCDADAESGGSASNRNKNFITASFADYGHIPAGMKPVFCESGLCLYQSNEGVIYWNTHDSTNAYPLMNAFPGNAADNSFVLLPSVTGAVRSGEYVVIHCANTLHIVLYKPGETTSSPRYLGPLQQLAAPPAITVRAGASAVSPYQISPSANAVIELDIDVPAGEEELTASYIRGDYQERKISSDVLRDICSHVSEALCRYDMDVRCAALFATPFLVSAAWRLADGSHTAPAAPQLIIPCSRGVLAVVTGCTANEKSIHLKLSLLHKVCSLFYRLEQPLPAWLESIGVTHLDFFITAPSRVELNDSVRFLTQTPDIFSISGQQRYSADGTVTFEEYGEHRPSGQTTAVRCFRRQQLSAELIEKQLLDSDRMYRIASVPLEELEASTGFHALKVAVSGADEIMKNCEVYIPDTTLCAELTARSLWQSDGTLWLADPKYTVTRPGVVELNNEAMSRMIFTLCSAGDSIVFSDTSSSSGYRKSTAVWSALGYGVVSMGLALNRRGAVESAATPQQLKVTGQPDGNLVYSGPGNPFSLSLSNSVAAGIGSVVGVAPSCRSASSSSAGRYPLYAFTTDGIWAVSMIEGRFLASQRVSAHKCIAAPTRNGAVALLANGAAFHTLRGVALLNGNTVTELAYDTDLAGALSRFPLMSDESTGVIMANASVYAPTCGKWVVASGREGIVGYYYDWHGDIVGYTSGGITRRLSLNETSTENKRYNSVTDKATELYHGVYDSLTPVRLRRVEICGGSDVSNLEVSVSDDGRNWWTVARSIGPYCSGLSGRRFRLIRIIVNASSPCHALIFFS